MSAASVDFPDPDTPEYGYGARSAVNVKGVDTEDRGSVERYGAVIDGENTTGLIHR